MQIKVKPVKTDGHITGKLFIKPPFQIRKNPMVKQMQCLVLQGFCRFLVRRIDSDIDAMNDVALITHQDSGNLERIFMIPPNTLNKS